MRKTHVLADKEGRWMKGKGRGIKAEGGEAGVSEGKESRGSHLGGRACAEGDLSDKESAACSHVTLLLSSRRISPT
jgi:hypothetical protein